MHGQQRRYFRLDPTGATVRELDEDRWLSWIRETKLSRQVAHDVVEDVRISTIFLGFDSSGLEPPLVWETRVDGGHTEHTDGYRHGYTSREAALAGHQDVVERVRLEEYRRRSNGQPRGEHG